MLDRFEPNKKYVFSKQKLTEWLISVGTSEDLIQRLRWPDAADGKIVKVETERQGSVHPFTIRPAWCVEVKEESQ